MKTRIRKLFELPFFAIIIAFIIFAIYSKVFNPNLFVYALKIPSGQIFIMEDSKHYKLQKFRKKEKLDSLINNVHNDFKQVFALTQWSSKLFPRTTPFPNYPPWDANIILSMIRNGETGGFCAQFAFVFGQACQSLGHNVRYIDLAAKNNNSGHFMIEVYIPNFNKWVAFEPEFGFVYYHKEIIPLSVLEIHNLVVNDTWSIYKNLDDKAPIKKDWLRLFYHFRYYLRNNFLSVPVYKKLKYHESGTQWIFEPYRLRWLDSYTKDVSESSKSISSSDVNSFNFKLRMDKVNYVSCKSVEEFESIFNKKKYPEIFKIEIRKRLLQRIIESKLDSAAYKQLK